VLAEGDDQVRLAVAPGSRGYYRIDRDGRIYTLHAYVVDPDGERGPRPGERPTPGAYPEFAYSVGFWLPTGQKEESPPESIFADDGRPFDYRDRFGENGGMSEHAEGAAETRVPRGGAGTDRASRPAAGDPRESARVGDSAAPSAANMLDPDVQEAAEVALDEAIDLTAADDPERRARVHAICDDLRDRLDVPEDVLAPIRAAADEDT
jgi:hypothetical protein